MLIARIDEDFKEVWLDLNQSVRRLHCHSKKLVTSGGREPPLKMDISSWAAKQGDVHPVASAYGIVRFVVNKNTVFVDSRANVAMCLPPAAIQSMTIHLLKCVS